MGAVAVNWATLRQDGSSSNSRRRFAQVRYDDNDHSYLGDEFPWYRLRSLIAEKLDARGIALEVRAQPEEETPGPLAEE